MGVHLDITMADNPDDIEVKASGSVIRVATDEDLRRYRLRKRNNYGAGGDFSWDLWAGVYHNCGGRYPDQVHFSDHDIYNDPSWITPVQLHARAVRAHLLEHEVKPNAYASQDYHNRASIPTPEEVARGVDHVQTYRCDLSQSVTDTVGTSDSEELSWGLSTTVGFEVGGDAAGYKLSVSATASIGKSKGHTDSEEHSDTHTISSGVDIPLGPGESALAKLIAGKGKLKVRVEFECMLIGDVAVNFHKHAYQGKHWHLIPIEKFLPKVGHAPPMQQRSFETYDFGFVTDGSITVEEINA